MAQNRSYREQRSHKAVSPLIPRAEAPRQDEVLPREAAHHREAAVNHQALPVQARIKIAQIQFRVAVQDQIRSDKRSLKKKERKKR